MATKDKLLVMGDRLVAMEDRETSIASGVTASQELICVQNEDEVKSGHKGQTSGNKGHAIDYGGQNIVAMEDRETSFAFAIMAMEDKANNIALGVTVV